MDIKLIYFNQCWNVYIYTATGYTEWYKTEVEQTKRDDFNKHEYRLRTYTHEIPIHTFGIMIDDPTKRPGHGGEWSSNARHINTIFNTNLTEVGVDGISVAVPIDWLKTALGNRVIWSTDDRVEIVGVVGEENVYDNVVKFKL